jgi:hypothetical protein
MTQVNRDPHSAGYMYEPTHAVTANFPHGVNVEALQGALTVAGFVPEQVYVFEGPAGAGRLDLKGERHGGWVRFRRKLEQAFQSYEASVADQAEEVLRSGGAVVAVVTGGDAARKGRAVEVLKSHGGRNVRYWAPGASAEAFL